MTWHSSRSHEDLHRFAAYERKIVSETITKIILLSNVANLHKSRNYMMSNDGLTIENIDLSHIYLAVTTFCIDSQSKTFKLKKNLL